MTINIKKFLRLTTLPLVAVLTLVTSLWPHDSYAIAFPSGWVSSYSDLEVYYRVNVVGQGLTAYRSGSYVDFANPGFIDKIEFSNTDRTSLNIPENSIWALSFVSENCSFEGIDNYYPNTYGKFMGMTSDTTGYEYTTYYYYNSGNSLNAEIYSLPISVNCQANSRFKATTFYSFVKLDTSEGQIDYTSALNDINAGIENLSITVDSWFANLDDGVAGTADAVERQTELIEEQQTNIENAQSDAQSNGDQSQDDATQTGTSLLGVFSSFVNALTNVSPKNNCYITVDLGHIDFGRLNLCESSPPAEFQIISSLIVIGFSVPVSLMLVNKMITLFRGFA